MSQPLRGQEDSSNALPAEVHAASNEPAAQDTTFLQSLATSMTRPPELANFSNSDVRAQKHAHRLPMPPSHSMHEGSSSDLGLDRLASLRMDSGNLSDMATPQEMRAAHRMMAEPYSMRGSWANGPRDGMRSTAARSLMYEHDMPEPGMYPRPFPPEQMNGMRGPRLMGAVSDPYMASAMPESYMTPARAAPRSRTHLHHYSATDFSGFDPHLEDYREGARWQPTTPPPRAHSLQRSRSEGVRLTHPRPGSRPQPPQQTLPHNVPESSTTSGQPAASKEPSSSTRAGLNESPDFAMIYAFLGSMFDPVCHMINHADVMQQMAPVDRETTILILENCVHNLDTPYFLETYLSQIRMVSLGNRVGPPPGVSRESSEYDFSPRQAHGRP